MVMFSSYSPGALKDERFSGRPRGLDRWHRHPDVRVLAPQQPTWVRGRSQASWARRTPSPRPGCVASLSTISTLLGGTTWSSSTSSATPA